MPTPLTWQLQGEDTSFTATVEAAVKAVQHWEATSVAAAATVVGAFQQANASLSGTPGGSASAAPLQAVQQVLSSIPPVAQAAATAVSSVAAATTSVSTSATATASQIAALKAEVAERWDSGAAATTITLNGMGTAAAATGAQFRQTMVEGDGYGASLAALAAAEAAVTAKEEEAAAGAARVGKAVEDSGKSADSAGAGFSRMGAHLQNLFVNQAVYAGIAAVQQGISAISDLLFQKPAMEEDALAVYTRELGTAGAAQARFQATLQTSIQFGVNDKELLALDERLAQLGITADTAQARMGRSLPAIQEALINLSLAPGMDLTKIEELFSRSADGAQRVVTSLESAGLTTRAELESMGVQFNKLTNTVISSPDVVGQALLQVADKFSGLGAAHAQTMSGIQQATSDTWDKIGTILGKDVFAQAELAQSRFLTQLNDPGTLSTVDTLGKRLGGVVTLISLGFDDMAQRAGHALSLIGAGLDLVTKPFVGGTGPFASALTTFDQIQTRLDALQASEAGLATQSAQTAAATDGLTTGLDATGVAAQTAAQNVAGLQAQLDGAKGAVSDLQGAASDLTAPLQAQLKSNTAYATQVAQHYTDAATSVQDQLTKVRAAASASAQDAQDATAPWQARLQALSTASADVKAHYDSLIQPLKDQMTVLDQVYQRQQDLARLADAGRKVATDRALSVDIYSSEGRAAATRLPAEIAAQQAAGAQATQNAAKVGLTNQIAGLQDQQQAADAGIAAQQRIAQAHITGIQDAQKAQAAMYTAQESALQGQITRITQARTAEQQYYAGVKEDLQGQIDQIKSTYGALEAGFTKEEKVIQDAITGLQTGSANALVVTAANATTVLNTIIGTVNAITAAAHAIPLAPGSPAYPGTTAGVGLTPIPPPTLGSATGTPLPAGAHQLTQHILGGSAIPHRAGGGDVSAGWYTVGERGPELLHAGGPGTVVAGGAGGDRTLTLVLQDPSGREWFRQGFSLNTDWVHGQIVSMIRGGG